MSPKRWSTIKNLFQEALEHPGGERTSWLNEACGGDGDLREQVGRLLRAEESAGAFFDTLEDRLRSARPTVDQDLPPPETIGSWRVVGEVGRGGMGRVLKAVRADGLFEQRVAIKVVDSHTPRLVRRFEQERRILARLEHPNICRLLGGGTLEDGRPYLVMEFVEGKPITAHSEDLGLSIDERLELFVQVCQAVAFAHRHLVVHRDLKPSNVLVTDDGQVKLLDFGIAKILEHNGRSDLGATRAGRRLLSPYFAAPEQILDESITTATDVYTLGILLYILLTGFRPFGRPGASRHEVEGEILQSMPPAPSTMVASGPGRIGRATAPGGEARNRSKRLRGDLDRIVLKSLRKEPERRYASVEALRRDIQRSLAGLPVEARPATAGYRLTSFVKRHKSGVAITVIFCLLAIALFTFSTVRIAAERDRAQHVGDFLAEVLSSAADRNMNARALISLLEPAIEQAGERLASESAARADVFQVGGALYDRAGRSDVARDLLHRALSIRKQLGPSRHADVAETLYSLGTAHIGFDRDSAEFYFAGAAREYRSHAGEHSKELAWSLLQWSRMLPSGDPQKEAAFEEAMGMLRSRFGARSVEVAEALHEYFVLGFGDGTREEIRAAFEESIAIYADHGREEHPLSIHAIHNLGLMLESEEPAHALELLRRSVRLGKENIERGTLGRSTMEINLGATLHERGLYLEADRILSEVTRDADRFLPDSSAGIAHSHYWYGRNLIALGRSSEAMEVLSTALEIQRHLYEGDMRTFRTQAELALAHFYTGDQRAAQRLILDAVTGLRGLHAERRALEHALLIVTDPERRMSYQARMTELEGETID